jgi:excisionase family DNA binding protein
MLRLRALLTQFVKTEHLPRAQLRGIMNNTGKIPEKSLQIEKDKPRYLDKSAAANYLGVSKRMMTRLVDERRIKFYRVGRFIRFSTFDLEQFIAASAVEAE